MNDSPPRLFHAPRRHVIVTGPPRTGKTTLLRAVAESLVGAHLGFFTEEIRAQGQRTGFRIVTLDGRSAPLAGKDIESPARIGPYGVDLASFESLAIPLLTRMMGERRLVLIDEIGKMECLSDRFRALVRELLDKGPAVLATAPVGGIPFIRAVKSRSDATMVAIDAGNRDMWQARIIAAALELERGDGAAAV